MSVATVGELPNGVRWTRNAQGHVWFGRRGGTGWVNDLSVVRFTCWKVRLHPYRYDRRVRIPKELGGGARTDSPPDDWVVATETVAQLAEARADPGVLLDALMDAYHEAWDLVKEETS